MLLALINKYGEMGLDTGSMHIILEDGNFGLDSAKRCKNVAIEQNDFWGETIATLLMEFTADEQKQIVDRPWEITDQLYG